MISKPLGLIRTGIYGDTQHNGTTVDPTDLATDPNCKISTKVSICLTNDQLLNNCKHKGARVIATITTSSKSSSENNFINYSILKTSIGFTLVELLKQ